MSEIFKGESVSYTLHVMGTAVMGTAVMGTYPLRFYTPTKMALASPTSHHIRASALAVVTIPLRGDQAVFVILVECGVAARKRSPYILCYDRKLNPGHV